MLQRGDILEKKPILNACEKCGIKMEQKFSGEFIKPSETLALRPHDPTMEIYQCPKCKEIKVVVR